MRRAHARGATFFMLHDLTILQISECRIEFLRNKCPSLHRHIPAPSLR